MSKYTVTNATNDIIWWKDGLWTSGELRAGDTRTFDTDHDANVTLFKKMDGKDHEIGKAWFPSGGTIIVHGVWHWLVQKK